MEEIDVASLVVEVALGLGHEGMGMPAKDYIDAVGLGYQRFIVIPFQRSLEAEMREANHHVAPLLATKDIHHSLGRLNGIAEGHPFALIGLYKTCHLGAKAEDTDTHPFALHHNIGFH